jgi:porin
MRPFSLRASFESNIIVALVAIATIQSTARAQLPSRPPGGTPPGAIANRLPDEPKDNADDSRAEDPEDSSDDSAQPAFGGPIFERSKLTGDWFGCRSNLRDHGLTLDVSSTQFYQGVAAGGLEQGFQYGGRNDYYVNLNSEKLGLWKGSSLTLHGETRYGESVNPLAGTLLAPNLMLALPQPSGSVTALTGVTLTQYLSEKMLIYGGKLNTLDGFEQPLTRAGSRNGFLNTAMLYNPVFARTVPYSTFGAGCTCLRNDEPVISVCVYDTNDTPTVSGFDTFFNNGVTVYVEFDLSTRFFDRPGHQGISGTYSNGKYSNLTPSAYLDPIEGLVIVSQQKTGSWCLAYNCDQALYVSPDDPERMWGLFGNFGIADSNPSPVRWFASAGISGASRFAGREADTFGVAYYYLGVSEPLKDLAPLLLPLRDEQGVELYYNLAISPSCQLTPDLQVIRPFRDRADTAIIVGLRANVDF